MALTSLSVWTCDERPNAPTPQRANAALLVLLVVLCSFGCDDSTRQQSFKRSSGATPATKSISDGDGGDGRGLLHDFGLLRPGDVKRHRFTIHNPTPSLWTVSAVRIVCLCTVLNDHSKTIKPFENGTFDVEYKAPNLDGIDNRNISVRFREPGTPEFTLGVSAQVRPELSCDPKEIDFGVVAAGSKVERVIEIRNFDEMDWPTVKLSCDSDVFLTSLTEIPITKSRGNDIRPRQSWRAIVSTVPANVISGERVGTLQIAATSPRKDFKRDVRLKLQIEPTVAAIPSAIFVGRVAPETQVLRTVLLRFARDNVLSSAEDILVEHDFGQDAVVACKAINERTWQVELMFRAVQRGSLDTRISLRFANSDIPAIEIPVRGVVE